MTVSTTQSIALFLGNGVTTSFTFSFNNAVPANQTTSVADYSVIYADASGNASVLSPTSYTLAFNAATAGALWGNGGTLTYAPGSIPIASGTSLQLNRQLPYEQLTSISNQGDFAPQVIEAAMDELEMQIQQLVLTDAPINPNINIIGATISPLSSSVPTNGIYLPGTNQVGISSNSALALSTGYYTGTGAPVNSLEILNCGTGFFPVIQAIGNDSNISIVYVAKGNGGHAFNTNGPQTSSPVTQVVINHTASAVNTLNLTGGTTGNGPVIGTSANNAPVNIIPNGTGAVNIKGTGANNSASAGFVGEYISASVASGASVSLVTATPKDITSISLTAGDWDVWGNIATNPAGSTTTSQIVGWISAASATNPGAPNGGAFSAMTLTFSTGVGQAIAIGAMRMSLNATTTVFLSTQVGFGTSTMGGYGFIGARRIR